MLHSLISLLATSVFAQGPCNGINCDASNTPDAIAGLITAVGQILVSTASGAAVLFVVYGGAQMIANFGDESKAEQGKQTVIFALIGFIFVLAAETIINAFLVEVLVYSAPANNPLTFIMAAAVRIMYALFNVTFIGMIMFAGYLMVMGRGTQDQYSRGKTTIIWAIAGAITINIARLIVEGIASL